MDLPDGGLPPGFVPTGPPTPMGTRYTGADRLGYGETPVVIPPPSGRSGLEETDSSSSDGTPPARYGRQGR